VLASQIAVWFVPVVSLLAVLVFLFWVRLVAWPEALLNAMSVLLVACPCAFGFATPLAIWTALGRLASSGLLARNGAAIERLASVDIVMFDKTGTLTLGEPVIERITFHGSDEGLVRSLIVAAERASTHPVARALESIQAPFRWTADRVRILPGRGIEARVHDHYVALVAGAAGRVEIAVDGTAAATVELSDNVLPGIDKAVAQLRQLGVDTALLTGDTVERAARIGLADTRALLTPEDKHASVVTELGAVAFVGDGINDAAAMSAASVSVAVSTGAPLAIEVADLVWTGANPQAIPDAIRIARDTTSKIRSNLRLALAYNAVGIGIAAAGLLHPVAAAVLMMLSSLTVTWRSLIGFEHAKS
jgi:P-type E1-E2 ATPase